MQHSEEGRPRLLGDRRGLSIARSGRQLPSGPEPSDLGWLRDAVRRCHDRTGEPTSASLPAGIAAPAYLSRLLRTTGTAFEDHIIPGLSGPLVRPIGPLANLLATLPDEHLEALAVPPVVEAVHGLPAPPLPQPPAGVVRTFDPMALAGDGWSVRIEMAFPSSDMVNSDADAVARMACVWHDDPRSRVRVTVYLCPDADAARRRLFSLRAKLTPPVTQLDAGPGIAFVASDGGSIVGATMNAAYKVIDAGERADASGDDAPRLARVLRDRLASASAPL